MPTWLGGEVRAQKERMQKKPEADCASTVTCRISVGFFLHARFLRTDFAGIWLHALYPAHDDHGTHVYKGVP